jgi:hypothetical protein
MPQSNADQSAGKLRRSGLGLSAGVFFGNLLVNGFLGDWARGFWIGLIASAMVILFYFNWAKMRASPAR